MFCLMFKIVSCFFYHRSFQCTNKKANGKQKEKKNRGHKWFHKKTTKVRQRKFTKEDTTEFTKKDTTEFTKKNNNKRQKEETEITMSMLLYFSQVFR